MNDNFFYLSYRIRRVLGRYCCVLNCLKLIRDIGINEILLQPMITYLEIAIMKFAPITSDEEERCVGKSV